MRAIWNGFISFGLVTIPVSIGNAQQRKDVSFRNLSRETMRPVKQKRWDPERDVEVTPEEMVKGWEASKGSFVAIEQDELERFTATQEKTIRILQFVDLEEVDPVYYDRAYWIAPQERTERPYALLAQALEKTGKAAVGRFVLSTKEHLVLVRAMGGALALQTLYYPEDVRVGEHREISDSLKEIEVADEEIAMAEQLIAGMTREFVPEEYPNETRASLLDFLRAKAGGEAVEVPEMADEPAPVVDLMAALKASLDASGPAAEGEPAEVTNVKDAPKKKASTPKKKASTAKKATKKSPAKRSRKAS